MDDLARVLNEYILCHIHRYAFDMVRKKERNSRLEINAKKLF